MEDLTPPGLTARRAEGGLSIRSTLTGILLAVPLGMKVQPDFSLTRRKTRRQR
jgi:hypothetical protein